MSQLKSCVADVMDRIRRRHDADPGEFWHACLFWTFWVSLALFPIGYGWREVTPPLCFIFLLLYYRHAWHRSVLRRLTVWPLFLCAGAMTLIGVVFSTDVWQSFLHGGMGVNKAYILPFIAMECVRSTRDLRRLVHACVLACVWQGLDGMWQAWTGFDFIMGYAPNAGRLTGSLGDYSVGNYMALAMIPAFACWFLLRRRLGVLSAAIVWVVLFIPAFFLLEGASSRSGILAVASAFVFWALLAGGRTGRIALWGCVLVLGASPCCPSTAWIRPPSRGTGAGASGPWAGRSSSSIPGWGRGLTATTPASGPWGSSQPMTPSPSATRTTCIWISCMPTASSASSWA